MFKFPKNFFWGAATSSYQVEGQNTHADWWHWEKPAGREPCGDACRHYQLYEQDFDLVQRLHHNAHRISIEWSRIEPEEGKFDEREIKHYLDVILALRRRNIEPFVTLHHFTNPVWFSQKGGWEKRENITFFLRYCDVITRALAPHVHFWMTINEPTIYVFHSYITGTWPPQSKALNKTMAVYNVMAEAHMAAYRALHRLYQELNLPKPSVGIAHHMQAIFSCKDNALNRFAVALRDKVVNFDLLDRFQKAGAMDFIGVNYYSRQVVHVKNINPGSWFFASCPDHVPAVKKNSLGWDIYPEGLLQLLLKLRKYQMPVVITENGICTDDDDQRWEFLKGHLKSVGLAIEQGVNVSGYLHWSLLDNFEWHEGYAPHFGLIQVDYKTFQRTVRPSALKYGDVCQSGVLKIPEGDDHER